MPKTILLLALLLPAGAPGLTAQTEYYARVGVVGASNLVRDVIISEITVRQSIAPMLALGGSLPIGPKGYRVGLEGTFASGKYHSSQGEARTELGTLRTGTLLVNVQGTVVRPIRWRAGLGAIHYWPSDKQGIFLLGGTTRFLAGAGLDYRQAVLPKWDIMGTIGYEFHRFSTEELHARGFSQTQSVNRFALSVGLARSTR
ncbi:MAG: hypothetical protein ACJ8DC_08480 [Gemmatimonadales bacterium]